ncbi:MAG: ATP-binding protein [Desulfobulbaceae bacterium]|nr:ATP-binding protein [Desulfobulbaceae bacterium]
MKTKRLLWQLFPANLLITLGALLVMTWFAASTARELYFDQMRQGLESRAHLIAHQVSSLVSASPEKLQDFCRQAGRHSATRITVVARDGTVLADSSEDPARMSNHANRPELQAAFAGKPGSSLRYSHTLGGNMLYVAIPLSAYPEKFPGALRLSVAVSSIDRVINSIYLKVALGCSLVIFLAGIFTMVVSRRIVRPLEEMRRGAERMVRGDTQHLLDVDSASMSTEVYSLAMSLNRMAKQMRERINAATLQHNELETVFASMAEMVLAVDTGKRIIRLNRSAAALFYLSPDDVKGKMLHGVVRNRDLHELVDKVLAEGEPVEKDIVLFVGPDKIYLQTRAVPLQNEQKAPIGVLVVLNDLTRLRKLENLRRDFVANVSHELKTPVTSIQGYVETLLDGALEEPDDARRFLEIVARQTARLDAIIDDLLTLSRIELNTDRDEISMIRVRLKETLDSALLTCQAKAAEKKINIRMECDDNLFVKINPNLIEQAVVNLLANGIAYSPEHSTVAVTAALVRQEERKDRLLISVEDQGIGIEKEHLERLFERFYRTDKARSSAHGGTGLGLSIVKHIAVAHGGSVTVRSEPGKGSIFTISIPQ